MSGHIENHVSLRCRIVEVGDNEQSAEASEAVGIVSMPDSEAEERCDVLSKCQQQSTRTPSGTYRQRNEDIDMLSESNKQFMRNTPVPNEQCFAQSNEANNRIVTANEQHIRMPTASCGQSNQTNSTPNSHRTEQIPRMSDNLYRHRNETHGFLIPETDKVLPPKGGNQREETERVPTPRWKKLLRSTRKRSLLSSRTFPRKPRPARVSSGEGDIVTRKQATRVRWNVPERVYIPTDESEAESYVSEESEDYYKPARPIIIKRWNEQGARAPALAPASERRPPVTVERASTNARDDPWVKRILRQIRDPTSGTRGPYGNFPPAAPYESCRELPSAGRRRGSSRRSRADSPREPREDRSSSVSRKRSLSTYLPPHLDVIGPTFALTISRDNSSHKSRRPDERKHGVRWLKRPHKRRHGGSGRRHHSSNAGACDRSCEPVPQSCQALGRMPLPLLPYDTGPAGQLQRASGHQYQPQSYVGPRKEPGTAPQPYAGGTSQGSVAPGMPLEVANEMAPEVAPAMKPNTAPQQFSPGAGTVPGDVSPQGEVNNFGGSCTYGAPGQCGFFPKGTCGGGPLGSCGVPGCGSGRGPNAGGAGYVNAGVGAVAGTCGTGPNGLCGSGAPGGCGRLTCGHARNGNVEPMGDYNPQPMGNYNTQPMGNYNAQAMGNYNTQPMGNYNAQHIGNYNPQPMDNYNTQHMGNYNAQPIMTYNSQNTGMINAPMKCGAGSPGTCMGGPPGSCGVPTCGTAAAKRATFAEDDSQVASDNTSATKGNSQTSMSKKSSTSSNSQKSVGGSHKSVGGSHKSVGGSHKSVGGSHKSVGGSQKSVGGASVNASRATPQNAQKGGFACNKDTCGSGKRGSCSVRCCSCSARANTTNDGSKSINNSGNPTRKSSSDTSTHSTNVNETSTTDVSASKQENENLRSNDPNSSKNDEDSTASEEPAKSDPDVVSDEERPRSESDKERRGAPCARKRTREINRPCSMLYVVETPQQSGYGGSDKPRLAPCQFVELPSATGRQPMLALALPPPFPEESLAPFAKAFSMPNTSQREDDMNKCPVSSRRRRPPDWTKTDMSAAYPSQDFPIAGWNPDILSSFDAFGLQKNLMSPSYFPSGVPPGPVGGAFGSPGMIPDAAFGDFRWPRCRGRGVAIPLGAVCRRAPRCQILSRSPLAPRPDHLAPHARPRGPAQPRPQALSPGMHLVPYRGRGTWRVGGICPSHGRVMPPRALLPQPYPISNVVWAGPPIYRRSPAEAPAWHLMEMPTATCTYQRPPSTTMAQFLKAVASSRPARVQPLTHAEAVPWRQFEDACAGAPEDGGPKGRSRLRTTVARLKRTLMGGSAKSKR